MGQSNRVLVPLRFLALVGHFLAALIFFYGRVALQHQNPNRPNGILH